MGIFCFFYGGLTFCFEYYIIFYDFEEESNSIIPRITNMSGTWYLTCQGIKLGYGRAVAIMRPPARINTAPRPNECGREPESAYLRIRSLLHSHFLPVCTALFPFNYPLRLNGTRAAPLFSKGLFRVLYPMFLGLLAGEVF